MIYKIALNCFIKGIVIVMRLSAWLSYKSRLCECRWQSRQSIWYVYL